MELKWWFCKLKELRWMVFNWKNNDVKVRIKKLRDKYSSKSDRVKNTNKSFSKEYKQNFILAYFVVKWIHAHKRMFGHFVKKWKTKNIDFLKKWSFNVLFYILYYFII